MRIKVDRDKCAGHARCYAMAPTIFELDDEGYSQADGREVPAGMEEKARRGANACPERAITLVDENK